MATRKPAVGNGPSSTAPMRINMKDEPQIAASNTKSTSHGVEGEAGDDFNADFQVGVVLLFGSAHLHIQSTRR